MESVCRCPLQDFAQQAESIFKGSDRRNDLDKAYVRLLGVIFEEIERFARDSHRHRTPSEVVMFGPCLLHRRRPQLATSCFYALFLAISTGCF